MAGRRTKRGQVEDRAKWRSQTEGFRDDWLDNRVSAKPYGLRSGLIANIRRLDAAAFGFGESPLKTVAPNI